MTQSKTLLRHREIGSGASQSEKDSSYTSQCSFMSHIVKQQKTGNASNHAMKACGV